MSHTKFCSNAVKMNIQFYLYNYRYIFHMWHNAVRTQEFYICWWCR